MSDFQGIGELDSDLETLDGSLTTVTKMTAGFGSELNRLTQAFGATERNASALETSLSAGVRKAINGLAFDGYKLRDSLHVVGQALIDTAFNAAVKPLSNHLGGLLAGGLGTAFSPVLPFADGAGFSQGRVMPFASGGIVSGPTLFPMRGGQGLMGEAGPEAIMPLARGADGKLGVRSNSMSHVSVVMNISTPDVAGFQRSESQIAARLSQTLSRGQRNR